MRLVAGGGVFGGGAMAGSRMGGEAEAGAGDGVRAVRDFTQELDDLRESVAGRDGDRRIFAAVGRAAEGVWVLGRWADVAGAVLAGPAGEMEIPDEQLGPDERQFECNG